MAGIYIKGMEMPENCYGCPIAQGYNRPAYCGLNGSIPKLWKEFDDALEKEIKPDFCPLIAVPDHGRLIDADAFAEFVHGKWEEKICHQIIGKMEWWRNAQWASHIDERTKDEVITVMQNVVDGISHTRQLYKATDYARKGERMTNAMRIRAMTDEELANMWWTYVDCGECPKHRECKMTGQDCLNLALEWLKQECDENGT